MAHKEGIVIMACMTIVISGLGTGNGIAQLKKGRPGVYCLVEQRSTIAQLFVVVIKYSDLIMKEKRDGCDY